MTLSVDVQIESRLTLYLNMENQQDTEISVKRWTLTSGEDLIYDRETSLQMGPREQTSQLIWLDHPYTPLEQREYEIAVEYENGSDTDVQTKTFKPTFEQLRVKGYSTEAPHPDKEDPLVELILQVIAIVLLPFYYFYLILEGGKRAKR